MSRKQHNDHARQGLDEERGRFEPAQDGHGNIQNDQIWQAALRDLNCLAAVLCCAAYFEIRLRPNQIFERSPNANTIVYD